MAPFNTHFLIAEKIWPELSGPWQPFYGQFCFGCVAPDVDKASDRLAQKDTHFYDRSGPYNLMASHRTAYFLSHQAEFLGQPFARLPAPAQAFSLGYLCHLCVDEVSKHMWRMETWLRFQERDVWPGAAFVALDELAARQIQDYPAMTEAVCSVPIPEVIPRIPPADLARLREGICAFMRADEVEEQFLTMVDLFSRPTPQERQAGRQKLRASLEGARLQVHQFNLPALVEAGLSHSRHRLADLQAGRTPEPGYPALVEEGGPR